MNLNRRTLLVGGVSLPLVTALGPLAMAQAKQNLTFGLSAYPTNLDAWAANNGISAMTVMLCLHRGLLGFGPDGALRAELAETWSRDGLVWTFVLREAKFHNGAPVTAEDVKWSVEQVIAPGSKAYLAGDLAGIASVEAVDAKTVRITTKSPWAALPNLLANAYMPVAQKGTGANGVAAVGAGPFTLAEQERGVAVTVKAFDGYYRPGTPKPASIRFVAYADENLRVSALQSGDIDAIELVPWPAMSAVEANSALRLDNSGEGAAFMYIQFNGTSGPFSNARVRRAVGHAIKREDIVAGVFSGRGSPLSGVPIPSDSPFFDASVADGWAYDPEKAKQLLKEAGFENGFKCTLLSTAQYTMHRDTAQIIQQYLAAVGIVVELALPDWATRTTRSQSGQYDIAVNGLALSYNDPDNISTLFDTSLPPSNVRSFGLSTPKLTELLLAGRAEADETKRKAIYADVQKVAIEEAPIMPLNWRVQGYGMKSGLQGFHNLPGALTTHSAYTFEDAVLA
jgi:peptide/nickel transport system substrate-binding protein